MMSDMEPTEHADDTTSNLGLRLLELQQEFSQRRSLTLVEHEFSGPGIATHIGRTESEIAADYEATLRELLQSPDA